MNEPKPDPNDPNLNAAKHFLPDYDDIPDLTIELQKRLTVPIKRVPAVSAVTHTPFHVIGTTWQWVNEQGVLTREEWLKQLDGGLDNLARMINEYEEFEAYPITHRPGTSYGVAYHDWGGPTAPFDIRLVITYGQLTVDVEGEELVRYGLKFHITTLVKKGDNDA